MKFRKKSSISVLKTTTQKDQVSHVPLGEQHGRGRAGAEHPREALPDAAGRALLPGQVG